LEKIKDLKKSGTYKQLKEADTLDKSISFEDL